jgi:hypothetical protein
MLAVALLAAGASILIGTPAFAEQVSTGCAAGPGGNWKLKVTANYTTAGGYEHWESAGFKVTSPPPSGPSHVDIALRGGGQTYWDHSANGVVSGVQYSVPMQVTIPASDLDYFRSHAIFDVPLMPDPSCVGYSG